MTASARLLGRALVEGTRRYVPSAVLLVMMMAALLLVPLVAMSRGYRPGDDALRHCAKAASGRAWGDVLVLSPAYTVDHHQGWHALLGWLHRAGVSKEGLLVFSVAARFLLALAPPLVLLPRGEYWLAGLAAVLFI
jgi:hypothetical protein